VVALRLQYEAKTSSWRINSVVQNRIGLQLC